MPYSIQYDDQTEVLTVTTVGSITIDERLKLLDEIIKVVDGQLPSDKSVKVLSDLREADIAMSGDELIQYGMAIAQRAGSRSARVATVYRSDEPEKLLTEGMLHIAAENITIASFVSIKEAYDWLGME